MSSTHLHVEIWLCSFDGRPPAFREFTHAIGCDVDGPFLRVTDADGERHWYPAAAITKATATARNTE